MHGVAGSCRWQRPGASPCSWSRCSTSFAARSRMARSASGVKLHPCVGHGSPLEPRGHPVLSVMPSTRKPKAASRLKRGREGRRLEPERASDRAEAARAAHSGAGRIAIMRRSATSQRRSTTRTSKVPRDGRVSSAHIQAPRPKGRGTVRVRVSNPSGDRSMESLPEPGPPRRTSRSRIEGLVGYRRLKPIPHRADMP